MQTLTVKSPAKINLYLKVLRKRADGYHDLATVFHRISLCDRLHLKKIRTGFRLRCNLPSLACDESNLITRAYRLLQKKFPRLSGIRVRLTKRIPVQAGLGGGSSNAAAMLVGMNRLYGLGLSRKELMRMGGILGADVPFFLAGCRQAFGTGRGDRIRPLPFPRKLWFVLLVDNKGLSTKDVFESLPKRRPAVSLTKVSRAVTMLCDFLAQKDCRQAASYLQNDLELPAFKLRPSLRQKLSAIHKSGILTARMSGSGPTVFALIPSQQQAKRLQKSLRAFCPSQHLVLCSSF